MKKSISDTLSIYSDRFSYAGYVFSFIGFPFILMFLFSFNCPYIISISLRAFLLGGTFFVLLGHVLGFISDFLGDAND